MGSGGVAIAALFIVICLEVPFSDGLGGGKIEALVNMEDFYKMLDSINPHILTDYIYMRLKHKQ